MNGECLVLTNIHLNPMYCEHLSFQTRWKDTDEKLNKDYIPCLVVHEHGLKFNVKKKILKLITLGDRNAKLKTTGICMSFLIHYKVRTPLLDS